MRHRSVAGHWPLIGVCYLPPLLGYQQSPGIEALVEHALRDYETALRSGLDGILLENENDRPYSIKANEHQIEAMEILAKALVQAPGDLSVGVEFLINDPYASLSVAQRSGAHFIRTDYYVDKMYREQYGVLEVDQQQFQSFRKEIGAEDIDILADVQVKYAKLLENEKPISLSIKQSKECHAYSSLISGEATGQGPDLRDFQTAKKAHPSHPLYLGSGLDAINIAKYINCADGAVVGTAILTDQKFDFAKCQDLVESRDRLLEKNEDSLSR